MGTHIATSDDTIPSIALLTGFFWKTLWNHPENANLKSLRKNPNILLEGDEVFVPELEIKWESRPTEKRHKFVRKGDPIKIYVKMMKIDKPRANEPYRLEIEGKTYKGNTDGDGCIKQFVPGDARSGLLMLQNGKEVIPLKIGGLDPVDVTTGVQQRLSNLGYECDETDELDDKTRRAIANFQADNKLPATGEPDTPTRAKLMEFTQ